MNSTLNETSLRNVFYKPLFAVTENQVAALVIFIITCFGMYFNWVVVAFMPAIKSLQNPYGLLIRQQALTEACHQTIFAFFYAPMMFFNIAFFKSHSGRAGHILLIFYETCLYLHVSISLNRFVAIYFPWKYDLIFSQRNTLLIILFSWSLAVFPSMFYFVFLDCEFAFTEEFAHFDFTPNPACQMVGYYEVFLKNIAVVCLVVTIDAFTVLKVHNTGKALGLDTGQSAVFKRKREINFLKQACLQACVFSSELICYFFLEGLFTDKWPIFFFTTVAWILVHATDGLIIVTFNKEFRKFILCYRRDPGKTFSTANVSGVAMTTAKRKEASSINNA